MSLPLTRPLLHQPFNGLSTAILVVVLLLGASPEIQSEDPPVKASSSTMRDAPSGLAPQMSSPNDLREEIKNLAHDSYLRREAAQRRLVAAGVASVPHLIDALQSGDLESIERASSALIQIGVKSPPDKDGGAIDRLSELSRVTSGRTSSAASQVVDEVGEHRALQARERLSKAGVFIGQREMMIGAVNSPRLIVQIDKEWTGDIEALHWLRWLRGVRNARVMGKALRGDVLEQVFSMPRLRSLALVEGTLDENALDGIKRQRALDSIDIRYVKLNDHQVDQIAATPLRASLTLMGTGVSSDRVKQISDATPGLKVEHRMGGFLGVKCNGDMQPCIIEDVVDGSAAHEAGLISSDIILEVDGDQVREFSDLQKTINEHVPGDELALKFRRGSKIQSVKLKLRRYVEEDQTPRYQRLVPGMQQQRIPVQRLPVRPIVPLPR